MADGMTASDLLELAIDWLAWRYPDSLIVPEFSIGNWGSALIDVAAIVPPDPNRLFTSGRSCIEQAQIIGIELKGAGDSPARLPLQAAVYSKAATRMYLLPAPEIEQRILRHAPFQWGPLGVRDGRVEFVNRPEEPPTLPTAPAQLLEALWRDELREVSSCFCCAPGRRATVEDYITAISETVPLRDIRKAVVEALLRRNWAGKPVLWARERSPSASERVA